MTSGAVTGTYLVAASEFENIPAARQILEAAADEERFTDRYRQWSRFRMRRLDAAEGKLRDFKQVTRETTSRYAARRLITWSVVYGLPTYPVTDSLLQSIRDEIVGWDTLSNPAFRDFSGRNAFLGDYHLTQTYLQALLDFRSGDQAAFDERRSYLTSQADTSLYTDPDAIPWRGRGRHLAHAFVRTLDALDFWQKGQLDEAIEASIDARMPVLWRATLLSILYAQPIRRFVLGEALLESGRLEEAREAFLSLTAAGHSEGLYHLGPIYLRLAEIHERLGEPEKAIEYYAKVLELWKDCDPELIPMRDDARRNLDRLVEAGIREPEAG
jgi:tetratricopeptide (TPR) repeat protein